ncbi:unnamed protein product [Colias eurytheme]|nr:unnamed protein product [Colias eurytheme]
MRGAARRLARTGGPRRECDGGGHTPRPEPGVPPRIDPAAAPPRRGRIYASRDLGGLGWSRMPISGDIDGRARRDGWPDAA